jgi:hypothetical protein
MENIFQDCIITPYPFKYIPNLSDNLYDYLWHDLFIANSFLFNITLKNALTTNANGEYI